VFRQVCLVRVWVRVRKIKIIEVKSMSKNLQLLKFYPY